MKYIMLFTLIFSSASFAEINEVPAKTNAEKKEKFTIAPGEKCYSECKPKKPIEGLLTKDKLDLAKVTCKPCLKEFYPESKKKASLEKLSKEKDDKDEDQKDKKNKDKLTKCTISPDKIYAYCNGETYKLDSSISDIERSMIKEIPEKLKKGSDKPAKASKQ